LILLEELDEVHELQVSINRGASEIDILTELADWLGDLQVYCASEMAKFGLDNETVLAIIMESNMSKLGEDGKPIYDDRGKVMKGPKYWKPEPVLKSYIEVARNS
jgi:predicted HAD superfamily Cof-like phosphohydrolase